jgi:transglutaminase-like putative cysteine protease
LRTDFGGFTTRRLVDARGRVLREESTMGIGGTLKSVAMTREEALRDGEGVPRDIVAMVSVPVSTRPDPRRNELVVTGYDAAKLPNEPPTQTVQGDRVTLASPLFLELPGDLPVGTEPTADTAATALLPAAHPEIVARARSVVGDATDRRTAVERLVTFVHDHVEKAPRIGIPDGLTVLREARGDCNEHTALFVSLARAVGIPARIAAGLVHHPQLGQAFYYHAWPEVRIGLPDASGQPGWIAVDPTFGQLPADATHLKLVTGDLDQQAAILAAMGRIQLRVTPRGTP